MTRWVRSVRFFFSMESMLRERIDLLHRPDEEQLLHWARDDSLHGGVLPPQDGRRHSVTSDGWCPCWARQEAVARPPTVPEHDASPPAAARSIRSATAGSTAFLSMRLKRGQP